MLRNRLQALANRIEEYDIPAAEASQNESEWLGKFDVPQTAAGSVRHWGSLRSGGNPQSEAGDRVSQSAP